MTSEAAVHQRNLESNILFMQQEHANTLKALHEEIEKLQKKCSDLTFQLTMAGLNVEDVGSGEARMKAIQEELEQARRHEKRLQEELQQKGQLVKTLEAELRSQRRRALEEQRIFQDKINSMKAELEAKSNSVAHLNFEIHRLKVKQKAESEDAGQSALRKPQPDRMPVPPPREPSGRGRRPAVQVRRTVPVASGLDEIRPLRRSSSKSNSATSSRSDSPDITPFVQREVAQPIIAQKPGPPVLPPIHSASKDGKQQLLLLPSRPSLMHRKPSSPQGLTTLAMESVPRADKPWPHAQESHSSEYN